MNIAIIGGGNVGTALGTRWQEVGHSITWGVPDPSDPRYIGMNVSTVSAAAGTANIVVLATPFAATKSAVESCGDLTGKIIVDATNPIAPDFSGLLDLGALSAGELTASYAPGANVVKAFNTVGANIMSDPNFGGAPATLLIAGDDGVAKGTVAGLATEIGFSPIDAGPLSMARYLESFAWVWIHLAVKAGQGRDIVWQLIKR